MKLWLDTETFSEFDLKTVGTYRYAENCEIMIMTYAIDDSPVRCWDLTVSPVMPGDLKQTLFYTAKEIFAHNAMFDRSVMKNNDMPTDLLKWRCTMVQALEHGLPGGLDDLSEIFKLGADQAKIKDGRRLVQLFCKPRPANNKITRATRHTHPEEWERFKQYAINDVVAMRALHYKMPRWNYPDNAQELNLWHLDQIKNDRGMLVDVESCNAAMEAIARAKKRLSKETLEQTNADLESTTKRDATLEYLLREYGISLKDLKKDTIKRALENEDIPEPVKELLRIRQQASSTSTTKYRALVNRVNADTRFRGGIQFSGAARTRRAAGRGFQPQNLPSRGLVPNALIDEGIELMKAGVEDLVFPNVMHLASSAVRKMIVAPEGKKLCIADLSNIEGRKVAWFANEQWKLKAFTDFDAGIGHDLYNLAYARAFKVPVESVTKAQRDIGKVMELACFHPDTLVLTNNGIKGIMEVLITDKLWDGVEWVTHQGVIAKNVKPVVNVADTGITEDHLILTRQTWLPAKLHASNDSILSLASATGTDGLRSLDILTQLRVRWRIVCLQSAIVGQTVMQALQTCVRKGQRNAMNVPSSAKHDIGKSYTGTRISSPMNDNGLDYSQDSQLLVQDAMFQGVDNITPMGDEEYLYVSDGEMILDHSWNISLRFRAGVIRLTKWIERIITKAMNPETLDSCLKQKITRIVELFSPYKKRFSDSKKLYDIAYAGPRNRFTLITAKGPLIVHNCGYQGGVGAFVAMAAGYGFKMEVLADNIFDTLPKNEVQEAYNFLDWVKGQKGNRYDLTDKSFVTADVLKRLWRKAHPAIVKLWSDLHAAAIATVTSKKSHQVGLLEFSMKGAWLRVLLPSGRFLCYPHAKYDYELDKITYFGVDQYTRQWGKLSIYAGKYTENLCQASARDCLYDSFPILEENGFPIILDVHDEAIAETELDKNVEEMCRIMTAGHEWTKGLPLAAKGFEAQRYRKE